jgi:hypothetical protein
VSGWVAYEEGEASGWVGGCSWRGRAVLVDGRVVLRACLTLRVCGLGGEGEREMYGVCVCVCVRERERERVRDREIERQRERERER